MLAIDDLKIDDRPTMTAPPFGPRAMPWRLARTHCTVFHEESVPKDPYTIPFVPTANTTRMLEIVIAATSVNVVLDKKMFDHELPESSVYAITPSVYCVPTMTALFDEIQAVEENTVNAGPAGLELCCQ